MVLGGRYVARQFCISQAKDNTKAGVRLLTGEVPISTITFRTTHPHPISRLRMRGAESTGPTRAFMASNL
jgi:hypothetical protein